MCQKSIQDFWAESWDLGTPDWLLVSVATCLACMTSQYLNVLFSTPFHCVQWSSEEQSANLILAILLHIPGRACVMVPSALQHTCTGNLGTAVPALCWIILLTCLGAVVGDANKMHWGQVAHGLVTSETKSRTPTYPSGLSGMYTFPWRKWSIVLHSSHLPLAYQQEILMLVSLLNFSSPFSPNVPKTASRCLVTLWIPASTIKCWRSVNVSISWKTTKSSTRRCLLCPTEVVLHLQLLHWRVPAVLQSLKPGEEPALCCSAAVAALLWLDTVRSLLTARSPFPSAASWMRYPPPLPPSQSHNSFICSTAHFYLIPRHMTAPLFFFGHNSGLIKNYTNSENHERF